MDKEQEMSILEKTLNETEEKIKQILESGITKDNLTILGDLIDIHKDIMNEHYWKIKEESYMHREYSNYGRRYPSYGEGSYGRRGVDAKYRGDKALTEMYNGYDRYSAGRDGYGRYSGPEDTLKSLEDMMESMYCFLETIKEDAKSPEEMEVIKHYTRKISEM